MLSFRLQVRLFGSALTLLSLFVTGLGSAQVTTYNRPLIMADGSIEEISSGVVEVDGRQFVASTVYFPGTSNIGIAEIDSVGNKVCVVLIGDSVNAYYTGWYNGLNKTRDGHLMLTGSCRNIHDSALYYSRTFLMKLTLDGQIVWMKILNDSIFNNEFTRGEQVIETSDKGFAVIGQIDIFGILYKTDSLGNIQWYKTFGENRVIWYEYLSGIEELPDSGFLIGSYIEWSNDQLSGDPWVYRLDKTGDFVWKKHFYQSVVPDGNPIPVVANDSTVLVLTVFTTKAAWFGLQEEMKLRIIKLRLLDGKILSDTMYGDHEKLYVVNQVVKVKDGTYVACGSDLNGWRAWIFGFTSEGDSLFLREYNYNPDTSRYDTSRSFYGCMLCSDGGILAVGEYHIQMGGSRRSGWIVKTDRYGCFSPGCDSNAIYILDQSDSLALCRNLPAEMSITTLGNDISYQWQGYSDSSWMDLSDTIIFQGINSSSLSMELKKLVLNKYWFRCKVNNNKYVVFSESIGLIIKDTVFVSYQPQDQFVRLQDSAIFSVVAAGQQPLSYDWVRNGAPIAGSQNDSLIIYPVTLSDTGSYYCIVRNLCGQSGSQQARLSINYLSSGEMDLNPDVLCYPNPAADYIMVEIRNTVRKEVSVRILDFRGEILLDKTLSVNYGSASKIGLNDFAPGIYILEIITGDKVNRNKFVKTFSQ